MNNHANPRGLKIINDMDHWLEYLGRSAMRFESSFMSLDPVISMQWLDLIILLLDGSYSMQISTDQRTWIKT